jgi:malate dehydrogenase
VVLVDVRAGVPEGKARDIAEARPIEGFTSKLIGTSDFQATAGSEVVVIAAGAPRQVGMSRDDLLRLNADVVWRVAQQAAALSPDAVLIVLSNPVDVMTYVAWHATGWSPSRVMGQAGVLDTARFCTFVADVLGVAPKDVSAFVLGGHGDTMVPLLRFSHVGGIPVQRLLSPEQLDAIVERTRQGGAEINKLAKGSAYYAPGSALATMVKAVLDDEHRLLPVVSYLDGEFGERDVYVGVPAVVGKSGVEQVVEIDLRPEEAAAFRASVEAVRGPLGVLGF